MRPRVVVGIVARYSLIVFVVAAMLLPFYWMAASSLKQPAELFAWPPRLVPSSLSLAFYEKIWRATLFQQHAVNSLVIALTTTAVSLVIGTLGAYSLSRFRYPGRRLVGRLVLFSYMFPSILLVIPLFILMKHLNLINTHVGLVVAYTTFLLPFILWLLKGFFDTLPIDIEEAAMVDGCGRLEALYHIVLPLASPGVAAAAMVAFLSAWNEYLLAAVFKSWTTG